MTAGRPVMSPTIALCEANMGRLPERVSAPGYDRRNLRSGVAHLSVGSFHRSHQAVYFDDLARRGDRDWGILGVGLRRPRLRAALSPQDGLYTVVTRSPDGDAARVIGAMTRYLFAPEDGPATRKALADPRTALVTLTITGAAYEVDAERSPTGRPPAPSSPALGYLVEALDRRRRAGHEPFTVLSCDNVPGNGDAARRALVSFAGLHDERLAAWIERNVAFPNSMVDRITPQTTRVDRAAVAREFGLLDRCPVITEPYSQWVLEDRFCNRRPPLDQVGVQFVDDVAPYALMKTRLLNASHCAIGFLGSVAGLRRADEAITDPVFRHYVERFMRDEIAPLLPPVPAVDLESYQRSLLERLANPRIGDELSRLCRAGSSKIPSHVVPSIIRARALGRDHPRLTMAVAGWFHYLRGNDDRGRRLVPDDPVAARLQAAALRGGTDPRPLLVESGGFGTLAEDPGFVAALEEALVTIDRRGVRAALAAFLPERRLVA
jgi:fructuronate reductase/mannitol 2-dehydrogenase